MSNAYLALNWVFLAVISPIMGLAVSFFTAFTVYLVFRNKTTLESMEPVRYKTSLASSQFRYRDAPSSESLGNIFDLGWYDNWCSVMGDHVSEWLLPIIPQNITQGTSFPINQELWDKAEQEAQDEQQQSQQANEYYQRQADYIERRREQRKQEIQRSIERDLEANSFEPFSHDYHEPDNDHNLHNSLTSEAYPLTRYR